MKRLVIGCATDLGPSGARALAWSAALARTSGAEIALIHVAAGSSRPDPGVVGDRGAVRAIQSDLCAEKLADAKARLDSLRSALVDQGVSCSIDVEVGPAWAGVLRAARRREVDLLVVGPHGRVTRVEASPRAPYVLGATSDPLVRNAHCPVWICPWAPEPWDLRSAVVVEVGPETNAVLAFAARLRSVCGIEWAIVRGHAAGGESGGEARGMNARRQLSDAALANGAADCLEERVEQRVRASGATVVVTGASDLDRWIHACFGARDEFGSRRRVALCVVPSSVRGRRLGVQQGEAERLLHVQERTGGVPGALDSVRASHTGG